VSGAYNSPEFASTAYHPYIFFGIEFLAVFLADRYVSAIVFVDAL
jgi:hypothetical protein